MKVMYKTGRRYDLEQGDRVYTVYANREGTIINTTLGADSHVIAIGEAIRAFHRKVV